MDARLGWPKGLTLGRLCSLWSTTQNRGMDRIGRLEARMLLMTDGAEGDKLLGALCHKDVHFLERRADDEFFIVGNPEQITKIERHREKSSKGGFAKAAKRQESEQGAGADPATGTPQAVPQADLGQCQSHASADATGLPTSTSTSGKNIYVLPPAEDEGGAAAAVRKKTRSTRRSADPPKPGETTWEVGDEFTRVFAHLVAIPRYREVFDRETERAAIRRHMEHYGLTIEEMVQVAYDLSNWTPKRPDWSPRGTLHTFAKKHAERKLEQRSGAEARKEKFKTAEDLA